MKEYLSILTAAAAFLALGLSLILLHERRNPPLPPPIPFFHEFGGGPSQNDIDEIVAYRKKVEAIRDKYHGAIVAVLSEEQRKAFESRQNKQEEGKKEGGPDGDAPFRPMGPPPPEFYLLSMIVYRPVLDLLAAELKLDAAQRTKVAAILEARRAEVLNLIDKEPLPSFMQRGPAGGCGVLP